MTCWQCVDARHCISSHSYLHLLPEDTLEAFNNVFLFLRQSFCDIISSIFILLNFFCASLFVELHAVCNLHYGCICLHSSIFTNLQAILDQLLQNHTSMLQYLFVLCLHGHLPHQQLLWTTYSTLCTQTDIHVIQDLWLTAEQEFTKIVSQNGMDVSFCYQITADFVECVYLGLSNDNFVVALKRSN